MDNIAVVKGTFTGNQGDVLNLILVYFDSDLFHWTEQAVLGIGLRMRDSPMPLRPGDDPHATVLTSCIAQGDPR